MLSCGRLAVVVALAFGSFITASALQQPPIFRGGADIVQVDANVQDHDGRFVSGLSAGDFTITESGRPQAIEAFYVVSGSRVSGGAPDVPADRLRRVYVVVFDQLHLSSDGLKRTKAAARTLFEKHFETADIGGVVSNGQIVNKRLTGDREELLKAVDSVQPAALAIRGFDQLSEYAETTNSEATGGAKAMRGADEGRLDTLTLSSAAELMQHLETVEGRKTVLLMSSGFGDPSRAGPSNGDDFGLIRLAVGGAQRANARVYAIDARGLVGGISNTLMDSLAADTGGYVIRNENRLDGAVARIVAEATTYYVLGYRRPGAADGKFRSIDVKVRRPGVTVRARRGYVAAP